MKYPFFLFLFIFLLPLSGQDALSPGEDTPGETASPVEGRYRSFFLGMALEDVKDALGEDHYFDYRGDTDVTMFNNPSENVIDCRGNSFIQRGWFQFRDEKLFVLELEMNRELIDYFTIYSQLEKKYGDPDDLTPQYATWYGEGVELSLEYPLTVKYLDSNVFAADLEESDSRKSFRETSRQTFVEEF